MAEQDNNLTPQKTAVAPQKTATAPQKTAVFSQKTAVFPQKTAAAPQKTAAAPQPTAAAPHMPGMAAPSGGGTYAPGETVKVSVEIDGRGFEGTYVCKWIMADQDGVDCFPDENGLDVTVISTFEI